MCVTFEDRKLDGLGRESLGDFNHGRLQSLESKGVVCEILPSTGLYPSRQKRASKMLQQQRKLRRITEGQ
jgi:hypothetical protein